MKEKRMLITVDSDFMMKKWDLVIGKPQSTIVL
jgi:predicted nuclease of predicted toxin-antitoxin system